MEDLGFLGIMCLYSSAIGQNFRLPPYFCCPVFRGSIKQSTFLTRIEHLYPLFKMKGCHNRVVVYCVKCFIPEVSHDVGSLVPKGRRWWISVSVGGKVGNYETTKKKRLAPATLLGFREGILFVPINHQVLTPPYLPHKRNCHKWNQSKG